MLTGNNLLPEPQLRNFHDVIWHSWASKVDLHGQYHGCMLMSWHCKEPGHWQPWYCPNPPHYNLVSAPEGLNTHEETPPLPQWRKTFWHFKATVLRIHQPCKLAKPIQRNGLQTFSYHFTLRPGVTYQWLGINWLIDWLTDWWIRNAWNCIDSSGLAMDLPQYCAKSSVNWVNISSGTGLLPTYPGPFVKNKK